MRCDNTGSVSAWRSSARSPSRRLHSARRRSGLDQPQARIRILRMPRDCLLRGQQHAVEVQLSHGLRAHGSMPDRHLNPGAGTEPGRLPGSGQRQNLYVAARPIVRGWLISTFASLP